VKAFFSTTIVCCLGLLVSGCDFNPTGIRFDITLNEGAVAAVLKPEQKLRMAAWIGVVPAVGVRPSKVFHVEESVNPDDKCIDDPTDLGVFICETGVLANPGANLYVGAFYEVADSADGVPDPGEFLTVTGPVTVASPNGSVDSISLTIVNDQLLTQPDVATVIATLGSIVQSGSFTKFRELLDPFYSDFRQLDFYDLQNWVQGLFTAGAVAYANPLSAPLAGLFSDDVRTALQMEAVTLDLVGTSGNLATVNVSYSIREKANENRFTVAERWAVGTRESDNDRLVTSINIQYQNFDQVKFTGDGGIYVDGVVTADWSDSVADADNFYVGIDQYNDTTFDWNPLGVDVKVGGSVGNCTFGPLGTCADGNALVLVDSGYYRVRVSAVTKGVSSRVAKAFILGSKR